jgi:uncharacterized protein YaiI (UPF0178 family)
MRKSCKSYRKLFVDADACPKPIKEAVLAISQAYELKVFFIASYSHAMNHTGEAEWVLVDANPEEVDLYITNHVQRNDVVVTQDHGLASILLPKGVYVLSPRGKEYLEGDMSELLFSRYLSYKQRRAGYRTKGPDKFTNNDVKKFNEQLKEILSSNEGNA